MGANEKKAATFHPGTELNKWSDKHMFKAEKSHAADGPVAYLLGGPSDPIGQIVACISMYKGKVVRSLRDVSEDERAEALEQMSKTALKMPLEAVSFHFMLEGVHRGITHQMVRQRTAAYAQESTRFAVKEDLADATALPISLHGTVSAKELAEQIMASNFEAGLSYSEDAESADALIASERRAGRVSAIQEQRLDWDEAVAVIGETYNRLVNTGMPAEDARGLMPTNITTRLNYITNLRSFYDTLAVRVSDQAQFEWRMVARAYALALLEYGKTQSYWTTLSWDEYMAWDAKHPKQPIQQRVILDDGNFASGNRVQVRLSSEWQYKAIVDNIKPIEFVTGKPAFGANFDRPSRIGERVAAFASQGVPSSEWTTGSVEHGIPPIYPEEYLLDPNAARLDEGMEFDIFGNRVPLGSGWHWKSGFLLRNTNGNQTDGYDQSTWPESFPNGQYDPDIDYEKEMMKS